MDINEVKDLIHEILQSDISEFELEHTDTRVRLKRGFGQIAPAVPQTGQRPATISYTPVRSSSAGANPSSADVPAEAEDPSIHVITSPIVGTVYRAANPDSEPYVKLGDKVSEGTILCLVEAMKLMNEIPSDVDGEIVRIYFENAHPVEFGQKLFGIRPENKG